MTSITAEQMQPETVATRRRPLPLIVLGVVVIAAVIFGVRRLSFARHHVTTDNAQVDGHITPIAPKVQAFVARVVVEDNQRVTAGDTLVVLDARPLETHLIQALAQRRAAEAAAGGARRAGAAESQVAAARSAAGGAQAAIVAAEAAVRKTGADLERYRGLAAAKVIPAQQLDQAQWAYDNARAALESARRQAAAAGSEVGGAEAGLSVAAAQLASADAEVESARLQLADAVIRAPANGIIAKRAVEVGSLVQPGQQLMALVPESTLWVTANLKETQLRKVSPGDAVEIEVDAYPGTTFHGTVESLSPATGARFALLPPDNATGNFTKVVQRVPVRIAVDSKQDPGHPLRPGMSAVVVITTR